jgi:serine protease
MKRKCLYFLFLFFPMMLQAQKENHIRGEFLVQLSDNAEIDGLVKSFESYNSIPHFYKCVSEPIKIWHLGFDETLDEKILLKHLQQHPSVLTVQFNHKIELRDITTLPNDPSFNSQWHLQNTGQNGGTVGADIQATLAWDITKGGLTTDGDTIVVAVIDDGFEPTHPDIAANQWYNWKEIPNNGIDDDKNGYVDDFTGWNTVTNSDVITGGNTHAVKVEGVLGAVGNNAKGIAGVNWNVKMMGIKSGGSEAEIVASYNYVFNMRRLYNQTRGKKGAFVVASNSSFGVSNLFQTDAPLWCAMYDSLGNVGVLNVGATANGNINVDADGDLPSTCQSDLLIVVTSSDQKDKKYFAAGYGLKNVDVAAPGDNIFTTAINGSYATDVGTSFSCPIVAGIAALAYSTSCPDFTNFAKTNPRAASLLLKDWILKSVDVKADFQGKTVTGGRVNAFKTLQKVVAYCGACQQASAVKVNATPVKATISWTNPANSTVSIQYRKKGLTVWIPVTGQIPLSINGLESCTDYELEVKTVCTGSNSAPFIVPFKTDGCCVAPEDATFSNITQNGFSIKFNAITAATGYQLCIKDIANGSCVLDKTYIDTALVFNNLRICNNYAVSLKSVCANSIVSNESSFSTKTNGCGPCFDLTYCKAGPVPTGNRSEWIDSFAIGDFKFVSGKNMGYTRFDTIATTLKSGKKYKLGLKPGFLGQSFNEGLRVWIDFNGDGDFADAGEQIWEVAKFDKTVTSDSVTIPNTIKEGVVRMRVAMKYIGFSDTPPQYCETYESGELEDYCVKLEKTVSLPVLLPDDFEIYPNPFSNFIVIKNRNKEASDISKIEIMTAEGRIIYVKRFETLENQYLAADLPPLSNGLFFIKIETTKGVLVKKIVRF